MMADILTQCRLGWQRGVDKRAKRKTPRLVIHPWVFGVDLLETKGRAIIHDTDGSEYIAEYSSYLDIIHDLEMLKTLCIEKIKKRAEKKVALRATNPGKPDGHTAA